MDQSINENSQNKIIRADSINSMQIGANRVEINENQQSPPIKKANTFGSAPQNNSKEEFRLETNFKKEEVQNLKIDEIINRSNQSFSHESQNNYELNYSMSHHSQAEGPTNVPNGEIKQLYLDVKLILNID